MASDREVEDFLTSHGPFVPPPHFREGEVFGEWRITAFLGRGGSAEVYRAVHEKSGDVVAIKVLVRATRSARARFTEEARLLSLSPGEAFPRFHGFAERDGWPYIVEECLEPFDLPVRDREVASFLLRLCAYVGGLHARGLVHRDLKPQNIMRRTGGCDPPSISGVPPGRGVVGRRGAWRMGDRLCGALDCRACRSSCESEDRFEARSGYPRTGGEESRI